MGVMLDNLTSEYVKNVYIQNNVANYFGEREVTIIDLNAWYIKFIVDNELNRYNEYVFTLFKVIIETIFLIHCFMHQEELEEEPYKDLLVDEGNYEPTTDIYAMLEYEYKEIEMNIKKDLASIITFKQCYQSMFDFNNNMEEIVSESGDTVSNMVIDWGTPDNVWCATIDGENLSLDVSY